MVDGDIDAWLERISWDTLKEWLDFMDEEPIGEERADLRAGALASVLWNVNLDTKKLGGSVKPLGYVSGVGDGRMCVIALKPDDYQESEGSAGGAYADQTLNDPIVWENHVAQMIKYHGGIKKEK